VRLEIADGRARLRRDRDQRRHLLVQVTDQGVVVDVEVAAAEVGAVAVRHLRAHRDTVLHRRPAGGEHRRLVTGVEPAGDVGLGDQRHQHLVGREALPHVGVQLHGAIVVVRASGVDSATDSPRTA